LVDISSSVEDGLNASVDCTGLVAELAVGEQMTSNIHALEDECVGDSWIDDLV
jgi:hypothetical protein